MSFQCCFCAQTIGGTPVQLEISLAEGGRQELRAHPACLEGALHPSIPVGWESDAPPHVADPYEVIFGSDIQRDGVYLELRQIDADKVMPVIEVFRSDRSRTLRLWAEVDELPFDLAASFLRQARFELVGRR